MVELEITEGINGYPPKEKINEHFTSFGKKIYSRLYSGRARKMTLLSQGNKLAL